MTHEFRVRIDGISLSSDEEEGAEACAVCRFVVTESESADEVGRND